MQHHQEIYLAIVHHVPSHENKLLVYQDLETGDLEILPGSEEASFTALLSDLGYEAHDNRLVAASYLNNGFFIAKNGRVGIFKIDFETKIDRIDRQDDRVAHAFGYERKPDEFVVVTLYF